MCYSIYLLHYPIISFVISRSKTFVFTDNFDLNLLAQFLIVAPVLLIISSGFFLFIEKPCMRKNWPGRLWEKMRVALRSAPQPAKVAD
jgi:peptidoglycan/LPS O-acetylase OafA/YrhL